MILSHTRDPISFGMNFHLYCDLGCDVGIQRRGHRQTLWQPAPTSVLQGFYPVHLHTYSVGQSPLF